MLIRVTLWLFALVSGYLLFEIYFLTALINSLSTSLYPDQIESLEKIGRSITGVGFACASLIWLTARLVKNRCYPKKRVLVAAIFPFLLGYFGVKWIFDAVVERASPEAVLCSLIGIAAKEALLEGRTLPIQGWNDEEQFLAVEDFQLGLLLLPEATCLNEDLRNALVKSESVKARVIKRMLYNQAVSRKLVDLFSDVNSLVGNLDRLYPHFIRVARKHERSWSMKRFYRGLQKEDSNVNLDVFHGVFARVTPEQARHLTKQQLLKQLISEAVKLKGYSLSPKQLPSERDASALNEAIIRLIAKQEVDKLKAGDYSLIESMGSEGQLGYRLMLIPLFVISVSSILIMLNIVSLIRLELLSWQHWGETKGTRFAGRWLRVGVYPLSASTDHCDVGLFPAAWGNGSLLVRSAKQFWVTSPAYRGAVANPPLPCDCAKAFKPGVITLF